MQAAPSSRWSLRPPAARARSAEVLMSTLEGGCLCGAIRYRVTGRPTNTMICHCQTCRRAAGAPVVAWLTFGAAGFQFSKGQPVQFSSTPPVRRTFFGSCRAPPPHSHLGPPADPHATDRSPDRPPAVSPAHHLLVSHDLAWVR